MEQQQPQPIRLTRRRAEALLAMVSIGIDEAERRLRQDLRATSDRDAVAMKDLKEQDLWITAAKDAMVIVKSRYAPSRPTDPAPPLF